MKFRIPQSSKIESLCKSLQSQITT